jgi:xanthosine utilization system XapX-like protein
MKSVRLGSSTVFFQVRSPALPLVAQIDLLGTLAGEQGMLIGRERFPGTLFRGACAVSLIINFLFDIPSGRYDARFVTVAGANERRFS